MRLCNCALPSIDPTICSRCPNMEQPYFVVTNCNQTDCSCQVCPKLPLNSYKETVSDGKEL